MATLRSEITELANTLNKVQQLATEANTERELRKLVHLLMVLWEEVIRQDLGLGLDEAFILIQVPI